MDSTLHGTSAAFLKHVTQTRLRAVALFFVCFRLSICFARLYPDSIIIAFIAISSSKTPGSQRSCSKTQKQER